jgi:hypothetical protein
VRDLRASVDAHWLLRQWANRIEKEKFSTRVNGPAIAIALRQKAKMIILKLMRIRARELNDD